MKKKALFIINPISGGKDKRGVPALIKQHLDSEVFDYHIVYSTLEKPITEISKEGANTFDVIVAVGGDGTVNETASALAGTDKILGITSFRIGQRAGPLPEDPNGYSKCHKNAQRATHPKLIDSGKLNGNQWFFNMAGMGFDAHISEVFSHGKTRGFKAYFKSSIQEISNYKPKAYHIRYRRCPVMKREAFMLSFANSSQYGNNAHVSPNASLHDGMIDVCVIKPFPVYRLLEMGLQDAHQNFRKFKICRDHSW